MRMSSIVRALLSATIVPVLVLTYVVAGSAAPRDSGVDLYVAVDGSDDSPGTESEPFATLEAARDAIRDRRSEDPADTGYTVHLLEGVHERGASFILTEEDSGAAGSPVVYRAREGDEVQIVGSAAVPEPSLQPVSDPAVLNRLEPSVAGHVLSVHLPSLGITDFGTINERGISDIQSVPDGLQVFQGSDQLTLARWPNSGWSQTGTVVTPTGVPHFHYLDDRPEGWANTDGARLMMYPFHDWAFLNTGIDTVDTGDKTIRATANSPYGTKEGARFYYTNVLEELDSPGEWYLDRTEGHLYVYPDPNVPLDLRVSMLEDPLVLQDGAQHIEFADITFTQSRGSAIRVVGGEGNLIHRSTFTWLGLRAADIIDSARVSFHHNHVADTGAGGVRLAGGDRNSLTPGENSVTNSTFTRYSWMAPTYSAAVTIVGVGNRVAHNLITDSPHVGIRYFGNNHAIEYNQIFDVVKEANDAGAIYTGRDWSERGTVIRFNHIRNVGQAHDNTVGVYLDDKSGGALVFGNIIEDVPYALHHTGRQVVFANNAVIFSNRPVSVGNWAVNATLPGGVLRERLGLVPYQQPPWTEQYPELVDILDDPDIAFPKGNSAVRNVFADSGVPVVVSNAHGPGVETMVSNWTTGSIDDIGFAELGAGDYSLPPNAPVYDAVPGFQDLRADLMGPEGDTSSEGTVRVGLHLDRNTLAVGQSSRIWAWAETESGHLLTTPGAWEFSTTGSAVTVDVSGRITATSAGTATVTANYLGSDGRTASADIEVSAVHTTVQRVTATVANALLAPGDDTLIEWTATLSDGTVTVVDGSAPRTYLVVDPDVADVDAGGRVQAKAPGTTRIHTRVELDGEFWESSVSVSVSNPSPDPLPPGWSVVNYGSAVGYADVDGSSVSLVGNGANIWGAQDDFTFMSRPTAGFPVMIEATVEQVLEVHRDSAAGLMARAEETATSPHVNLRVLPSGDVRLVWRGEDGGVSQFVAASGSLPQAIRLEVFATHVVPSYSEGNNWVVMDAIDLSLDADSRIGLTLQSNDASNVTTARFTGLLLDGQSSDPALPEWTAAETFVSGDRVRHEGAVWSATWWTQGQTPGDPHGPWQEIRNDSDGAPVWTASRVFDGGDEVLHQGARYLAQWWTRNQEPGDPHGPWLLTE